MVNQYPHQLYHQPTRVMTQAEQAQAYRELVAYFDQITQDEETLVRVTIHRNEAKGKVNAILARGLVASCRASVEACQSCGYLNCNCESVG